MAGLSYGPIICLQTLGSRRDRAAKLSSLRDWSTKVYTPRPPNRCDTGMGKVFLVILPVC
ncbi:hypothetical protein PENSPDRAFT_654587 [Peniophora sp. CONT]|nr:hypothetical protein PENSPDRAFT_654587 [Peniophora sp. CONT]